MNHTVLVTGVGGNVGQGILRNIRRCAPEVRVVGTDVVAVTAGHHFCDRFHQVPPSHERSYRRSIVEACEKEAVDLIIPATDAEAHHLGLLVERLPTLLASPAEVTGMCLDKYLTGTRLQVAGVPFAQSVLPSDYRGQWSEVVVKPREGRGSRNIHHNPPDLRGFDDTYVVQPRLEGCEVTTAFYVLRDRRLLGSITLVRDLRNGMTDRCTVAGEYDKVVNAVIRKLVAGFEIRGPCNLQSIITANGDVVPFEINCRYSGTNSIRAHFGFDDVRYGLQEYLFHEDVEPPHVTHGSAMRVYLDIIYPGQDLSKIEAGSEKSFLY